MKKILIILSLLAFSSCGGPPGINNEIRIKWSEPTDGAPVSYYILEVTGANLVKSYETYTTFYDLEIVPGIVYTARVAGVGSDMAMGIYSETSKPFKLTP